MPGPRSSTKRGAFTRELDEGSSIFCRHQVSPLLLELLVLEPLLDVLEPLELVLLPLLLVLLPLLDVLEPLELVLLPLEPPPLLDPLLEPVVGGAVIGAGCKSA